jgi:hypothetical protein
MVQASLVYCGEWSPRSRGELYREQSMLSRLRYRIVTRDATDCLPDLPSRGPDLPGMPC